MERFGKDQQVLALELYDHASDPRETVNLANEPGEASTVLELADRMAAVLSRS